MRGPEESAAHVEEAEQPDESAGGDGGDSALEHFLDHRRSLLEDADARGDVECTSTTQSSQNCGVREGGVHVDVVRGDQAFGLRRRRPSRRASSLARARGR